MPEAADRAMPADKSLAGDPASASASNGGEKEHAAPGSPPREADPELVKQVRQAAAEAGPADVAASLKKIAQAFMDYAESHDQRFPSIDGTPAPANPSRQVGGTPPDSSNGSEPKGGLSWRVAILPQLGLAGLYQEFHLDEAWDSPHNKQLLTKMPPVFGNDPDGKSRLHLITGPGTPFQAGPGPLLNDFIDGLSNTLTVVQAGEDRAEEWTRPGGLAFDVNHPEQCLGEVDESFLALTADGALHRIPIETDLLANLIRHQDKQIIPSQFSKETLKISKSSGVFRSQDLPPLSPASQAFDPQFVPDDATSIIVISPRRILESKVSQAILGQFALPDEAPDQTLDRLVMRSNGSGIPVLAIEEIRIIPDANLNPAALAGPAGAAVQGQLPPGVAAIYLRSSIPLPLEPLIQEAAQTAEKVEVEVLDGIPHVWLRGLRYALAFPSDHEAILAANETIRKMTAPPPSNADSQKLVESVRSLENPMIIFAASAPGEGKLGFMQQFMANAGPVGLLAPQLADSNAIRLSLDLDASSLLKLSLGFPQEETAKTFLEVARNFLAQGIAQGKQFQATLKENDPAQKAQSELLGDVLAGSEVNHDGTLVSLVIRQPRNLEKVVTAFQKQVAAIQTKMTPVESLPPLERVAKALLAYSEAHGHLPASNGMGELEEAKSKNPRSARNAPPGAEPEATEPSATPSTFGPGMQKALTAQEKAQEKADAAIAKNRGLSWRVYLLPLLGEQGLYEQFHLNERWDSPHNRSLIPQMPAVFGTNPEGKTRFQMIVGSETLFKSGKSPDVNALRDDPAQTIVVIETGEDKADFWTKPGGLPFDPRNPTRCLGKADDGQAEYQAIMLDWSVQKIPTSISEDEFRALVQPSDGKPSRKDP